MAAGAVTSPFPPFMVLLFTCEFWGAVLPLMTIPRPRNNKKPKTHPKPKDNGGCLWVSVGYWCLSFLGLGVVWVFFRAFTLTPNPQVKKKNPKYKNHQASRCRRSCCRPHTYKRILLCISKPCGGVQALRLGQGKCPTRQEGWGWGEEPPDWHRIILFLAQSTLPSPNSP